jgi:transcriptional regulator GlxA family with amidase domain
MDGRIFHLKELFSEKLDHKWTVKEMSEIVDLSPAHLPRVFKINIGISPMAYLNTLRLEKARELLENTFLQVKQIGRRVGLKNDSHFTREFRKKFGFSPTEYRKLHWGKTQNLEPIGRE